ncbi:MAG: RAMP superfamily CRISPR-associated protein [Syntrophomonadaceae bacterium]|jgi:CRISPR/Cas system CSM-associated protein Csm3 (group 7 of RAMP superfamily)
MVHNKTSDSATIVGRMLLKGKLKVITPLIIGGGRSLYGDSNIIVLKDEAGRPYIPSSSITGALKHAFEDYQYVGDETNYEENKLWFWGGKYKVEKNGESVTYTCQSALVIADIMISEDSKALVRLRDGIKIDRKTGTVESSNKFDFEIVEPGISFNLEMEVVIRKAFNDKIFRNIFDWIAVILSSGEFALGARTGQGFGLCRLEDITTYEFNFNYENRDHVIAWLSRDPSAAQIEYDPAKVKVTLPFHPRFKTFRIEAVFAVKSALIVGSYPGDTQAPDKVHISSQNYEGSGEIAVVPGTSLRGAIRSRAERIVKTLNGNSDVLNNLFGWVDSEKGSTAKPIRGKIRIKEKQIPQNTYREEIQHRIQIDRFTGGVIDGAFFDSMPIWSKENNDPMVTLDLEIKDFEDWEAGLMLLVLKDLWNGDLAVGGEKNVGRGVLQGLFAIISFDDRIIKMRQEGDNLLLHYQGNNPKWDDSIAELLEEKVASLIKHLEENNTSRKEVTSNA